MVQNANLRAWHRSNVWWGTTQVLTALGLSLWLMYPYSLNCSFPLLEKCISISCVCFTWTIHALYNVLRTLLGVRWQSLHINWITADDASYICMHFVWIGKKSRLKWNSLGDPGGDLRVRLAFFVSEEICKRIIWIRILRLWQVTILNNAFCVGIIICLSQATVAFVFNYILVVSSLKKMFSFI